MTSPLNSSPPPSPDFTAPCHRNTFSPVHHDEKIPKTAFTRISYLKPIPVRKLPSIQNPKSNTSHPSTVTPTAIEAFYTYPERKDPPTSCPSQLPTALKHCNDPLHAPQKSDKYRPKRGREHPEEDIRKKQKTESPMTMILSTPPPEL